MDTTPCPRSFPLYSLSAVVGPLSANSTYVVYKSRFLSLHRCVDSDSNRARDAASLKCDGVSCCLHNFPQHVPDICSTYLSLFPQGGLGHTADNMTGSES